LSHFFYTCHLKNFLRKKTQGIFLLLLLMIMSQSVFAQLCTGTLGAPVINISFGAGNNPGAPLAAATSSFQYQPNDCPNDSFYTVRNSTSQCFGSTWHTLTSDHTGDANGYCMLVNATVQPSVFYVDTVRGLCGNITFEFAAWIMNIVAPIACGGYAKQPNITFTIEKTDGTILRSYNSGNIGDSTVPTWKQYGFFFTTPPGANDLILKMVNNAPGGCGNDLALDDITFRPCGPQIIPTITGETTNIINICEGAVRSFTFNCNVSGGFTSPVYQWQQRFNGGAWVDIGGASTTFLTTGFTTANPVGNYEYKLTVAENGNQGSPQCTISSQPFKVSVNANPVAVAGNSGPVCAGNSISLSASGGSSYLWSGPNGFSDTLAAVTLNNSSTVQSGSYQVKVTSAAGCSSITTTNLTIDTKPTASTPFTATSICAKDSVQLFAAGAVFYKWEPATGLSSDNIYNPKASPGTTGSYRVIVSTPRGCDDTAFISIKVFDRAIANAGPDRSTIPGIPVILSGSIAGDYLNYYWSPVIYLINTGSLVTPASPPADRNYVLTVVSKNNCGVSSDSVLVKVGSKFYIPNAFSPNGDGLNDTWNIPALDAYPDFELFIFDRYGEPVFKNSRFRQSWDGYFKLKPLPTGTYAYIIKLNNAARQIFKGTVMLLH
jgi:gliding motility-associated-like protein